MTYDIFQIRAENELTQYKKSSSVVIDSLVGKLGSMIGSHQKDILARNYSNQSGLIKGYDLFPNDNSTSVRDSDFVVARARLRDSVHVAIGTCAGIHLNGDLDKILANKLLTLWCPKNDDTKNVGIVKPNDISSLVAAHSGHVLPSSYSGCNFYCISDSNESAGDAAKTVLKLQRKYLSCMNKIVSEVF